MMKKFLLMFFFAMQVISCGMGTIEAYPESTKLSIQNDSGVRLLNVRWNGFNFGDIGLGDVVEREVLEGNGKVFFEASNKEYRTYNPVTCEKHKQNRSRFIDATHIEYNASRITIKDILNAD